MGFFCIQKAEVSLHIQRLVALSVHIINFLFNLVSVEQRTNV